MHNFGYQTEEWCNKCYGTHCRGATLVRNFMQTPAAIIWQTWDIPGHNQSAIPEEHGGISVEKSDGNYLSIVETCNNFLLVPSAHHITSQYTTSQYLVLFRNKGNISRYFLLSLLLLLLMFKKKCFYFISFFYVCMIKIIIIWVHCGWRIQVEVILAVMK